MIRNPWIYTLFLMPALLLSASIVLVPGLLTFVVAFTNWNGATTPDWVGGSNFSALFADPVFWRALSHNMQWVVIFLTIPMALGLLMASILRTRKRSHALFQLIVLLPYVLSPVANAMIWQNIILNPVAGVLAFVNRMGLPMVNPLSDVSTSLYAVAAIDVWHFWGYLAVVFLAAMRQTPDDQLEAALMEGANGWQVFREVVMPNILPTIGLMFVFTTIFSFLTFDYIFLLTKGGPARSSEILSTFAYDFAFTTFQVGKAAAVALVMGCFGLVASIVYVSISQASMSK
ncbi:carbohydrate ABC transporter permease [Devosia sp. A449]